MKTINIYITKEQKQKAYKIQEKYRVSLSTIVGCVTYWLYKYLLMEENKKEIESLTTTYINKTAVYKTSVKPRELNQVLGNEIKNKNTFGTNATVIFLEKSIENYLTDKKNIQNYWKEIDRQLTKTEDPYWDYNSGIRIMRRMIRQNKSYWKKVIEDA